MLKLKQVLDYSLLIPLRGRNLELLILLLSVDVYCGIARQVRPVITIYCKKLVGREVLGEMEGARGGGDGGLPVILLGKYPIEEQ